MASRTGDVELAFAAGVLPPAGLQAPSSLLLASAASSWLALPEKPSLRPPLLVSFQTTLRV